MRETERSQPEPNSSVLLSGKGNGTGNTQAGISQRLRLYKCLCVASVTTVVLILIIIIIFLSQRTCASSTPQENITHVQCPDGWIINKGKCYHLSVGAESWENSQRSCEEKNSSLAIIDNNDEYKFLNGWIEDNNRWIGLNSKDGGSNWSWIDGKQYIEDFLKIGTGTKSGDKQYVYLSKDSVKSENDGNLRKKFFCNKKSFT